ncbi:DNA recombination protein RmuC [Spiroplasma citri]|uniref:DNA recombination protein RmuC n=1 Tax=Spiroplasma citri TaxID=2133 RepID=A0AAJ4EKV0_SPICI|nr:DNA recombination protein RmuC [Spiroplasma citri]APE75415.1 DNA recombination protein RmuC [Spiroplasma citri]QED25280.1 DNA recombination protein RmuC [Spiroplasma citri]QIA67624.1 DNA recombination protein RmuC [Spiroplasma citri]QIA69474.1 DNA recombination protein RmuC [Spiroplasma citri]QIA71339.1 DNA recombination protein RmuC [Spiroplasma citri]
MTTISYVLLGIILVILVSFLIIYLVKTHKKPLVNNDSALLQKDIQASKELLEKQGLGLQNQLSEQKRELLTLISEFQTNSVKNDAEFNRNLAILNEGLNNFKNNLSKQDTDLKNNLNHQGEIISKSFTDVLSNLKVLKESTTTLKEVETKVKTLNDIFLNNKKRGNLGEYLLEKVLSDMYGERHQGWERQYKLPTGTVVDALVKTGGAKENIAIDAKFPLSNYNKYLEVSDTTIKNKYLNLFKQDLKDRINEVAKYINLENEISSAIMFVPSEDLFAFIYGQFPDDIITFAFKKRVWVTSPTTLSAILFVLEKHMREVAFNQNIEAIKTNLLKIKGEFERWVERWQEFTKNFVKFNTSIEQLNTTHNKIHIQYQKILNEQQLEQPVD